MEEYNHTKKGTRQDEEKKEKREGKKKKRNCDAGKEWINECTAHAAPQNENKNQLFPQQLGRRERNERKE